MKNIFSLFIDDFTHLDGAIWHPLRGAIGISYQLGIEFTGKVQNDGTVFDFSAAKKCAKKIIDSTADHAFTVPKNLIEYVDGDYVKFSGQDVEYIAPKQAFYIIDTVSEMGLFQSLEQLIFEECKKRTDCAELQTVNLIYTIENSQDNSVYFNYTHGLKENTSNCQRLIHGHRSTIKVWINEERSPIHEKYLADMYHDKHLAIAENIQFEDNAIIVKYTSGQGTFTGQFDANKVLIMPYETTIENISKFSAETLKNDFPELRKSVITVAAYEGIGKGSKYTLDQSYKIQKIEQILTEGLM